MFDTILIANRGEIACRVIRTARRMGIRTVAVYSDADRGALHATMADAAIHIGLSPARDSYLNIPVIIAAAQRSGAQAIHPGYGFLSENPLFAEACAAAGIVFIGPPAAAIRAMGSKSAAKAAMEQAGVPLVPGYHGADQDPALLAREAARIGYPVLIKASAGGGGKGMRIVESDGSFTENLALAKGEALAAFGDDQVLVERYLTRPRHIEIQVFADQAGQTISLFERDCSIQRRHQKIVEEAPAPGMTEARRAAMGQAAIDAAKAIGYVGAGTVEFIVEGDAFFFMEMNTRLQVEHPVTEMITRQDLVEWQLRVAAGEPLPTTEPGIHGHAIEVRLYAEDPGRDFMPATGRLLHLATPAPGHDIRIETGVRAGDTVTIHYDPMIAKLVVWGETRDDAVRRLRQALAHYEAVGVQTNLPLLRRIAAHPDFAAAKLDTGFIPRHEAALLAPPGPIPQAALAAAAAHVLAQPPATSLNDPYSPWASALPWRLNGTARRSIAFAEATVAAEPLPDGTTRLYLSETEAILQHGYATMDGIAAGATIVPGMTPDTLTVIIEGQNWPLHLVDPLAPPETIEQTANRITAPMPGRIVAVSVAPGQAVQAGQVLLVLEAMKVQMRLPAPRDGTIAEVHAVVGTVVEDGAELVTYQTEE